MKTLVYAIIKKNGTLLILKRPSDKKSYPNYWNLPGGKLEEKELDIDCVKREVMEETNMNFSPFLKVMDTIDYDGEEKRIIVFLGDAEGDFKLNHEHSESTWITPNEIKKKNVMPYITRLFHGVI